MHRHLGSDALRTLAHNIETDVTLAALFQNILVDADAVVDNREFEFGSVLNIDEHLRGLGVLAHVGKRLLHDEDHLNLLSIGEFNFGTRDRELHRQFRLRFKTIDHCIDRFREAFGVHALAEVQKQFAHVFVGFLHARLDLSHCGVNEFLVVGLKTAFQ